MSLSVGDLVGYLKLDKSDWDRGIGSAESDTKRAPSWLGGLGKVAMVAGAALGGVGIAGAAVGLKTAAGMEQAKIAFTTMLGSAEKADVFLKQLADFAAKTPFEFPELQTAASSLISAGFAASDVIPIMTTLGDVTSGMGTGADGIKRATVALQQMSAAGKITGEDLNQLRDAGVPVFDLLAAATGKSKEEIAKLAAAGKLGKDEMNALFAALESGTGLERFSGLMEAQSHSLTGVISTLKDTVGQGLAKAFAPIIPLLEAGIPKVASLAGVLLNGLGKALAFVIGFFTHAGDAGKGLLSSWSGLMPTLVHLKNSFMITFALLRKFVSDNQATFAEWGAKVRALFDVVKSVVLQLVNTIASHLPEIAAIAEKAFLVIGNGLSVVVGWITKTIDWFSKHKAAAIALGAGIALLVAPIFTLVAALVIAWQKSEMFRKVVGAVFAAVKKWITDNAATFKMWADQVVAIVTDLMKVWQTIWDRYGAQILGTITSVLTHIWQIVLIAFNTVKTIISTVLAVVLGVVQTAMDLLHGRWGDAWGDILGILRTVWDAVLHLIGNAFKIAGQLFGAGMDLLKLAWQFAWDAIKSAVSAIFDTIVGWVAALPGRFLAAGALIWDWIREKATHILADVGIAVAGFFDWVKGLPGNFATWAAKIWDFFWDLAGFVWGKVETAFATFFGWVKGLPGLLAEWAGDVWGWIVDQAKTAGSEAWAAFKEAFLSGLNGGGGTGFWSQFVHSFIPGSGFHFGAEGGVVRQAQPWIVGEAGPEAIVPLDRFERMLDRVYAAGQQRGGDGMSAQPYGAQPLIGHLTQINPVAHTDSDDIGKAIDMAMALAG